MPVRGTTSPNVAPIARIQAPGAVTIGSGRVVLDGSGSEDPDGTIESWAWRQSAGDVVVLAGADAPRAEFDAPAEVVDPVTFELTVTDDQGASASASATVRFRLPPMAVEFRLDSLHALRAIGSIDSQARWSVQRSGATSTAGTGPGASSAGPYVYLESSLLNPFASSPITLTIVGRWQFAAGRVLGVRCSVQGAFADAATEGLVVETRAGAGAWQQAGLIRGWGYADYAAGATIRDYGGTDHTCVAAGGWIDVDVRIPDEHDGVRLRVEATPGSVAYRHDVALWALTLGG